MATAKELARSLLKEIAMDIGKETVVYIRVMYPKAIEACPSTFPISVRNCIYNQIMAAFEISNDGELIPQFVTADEHGEVINRLTERDNFRRKWLAQYRKIRENDGQK